MKRRLTLAAALLAIGPLSASAAGLLGDTLVFNRSYPTPDTTYTVWNPSQVSTKVTPDATDTIHWAAGGAPLTIDPGAHEIVITFGSSTGYISGGSIFDGFRITGFGHDILSASVASETLSGSVSLQVLQRQLNLGVNGSVSSGQAIVLSVSVVPEPGTWALMLGGMVALGALARRRSAAR